MKKIKLLKVPDLGGGVHYFLLRQIFVKKYMFFGKHTPLFILQTFSGLILPPFLSQEKGRVLFINFDNQTKVNVGDVLIVYQT